MNKSQLAIAALLAGAVMSTGCEVRERTYYHRPREVVVVSPAPPPRPVYVQPAPPPPPAQPVIVAEPPPVQEQVTVVQAAPPPVIVEVRPRFPGRGYVWASGYWVRHRDRWVWVSGRWSLPPRAGAIWVPHAWVRVGGGFQFHAGYWR